MKIVMLNGQNHKGSSYHIGRSIVDKIEGENQVTEFFFPKDLNHFCMGCYQCIEDVTKCYCYHEKKVIIDAIDAADVIVVTTPTYCMHLSAPLKAFFDLTFDMWMVHRPMESMFTKKSVIVSTAAGSSPKSAMNDVQDALFYMGIPEIIKYGLPVQAMDWEGVSDKKKEKIDKDTDRIAKKLSSGNKPVVRMKTRFMFMIMGMLHKKGWDSSPVEAEYWKEKGWLAGKKPWNKEYTNYENTDQI